MRHEQHLIFTFILMLLTACATESHEKEKVSVPSETGVERDTQKIKTRDPTCIEPPYLVRDLTVPWAQRTYLVGPCEGRQDRSVGTRTPHDGGPLSASGKDKP
jgi:hypothetical protein